MEFRSKKALILLLVSSSLFLASSFSGSQNSNQEILETREKAKAHIWTFRTSEEASVHWKEQFGHLDEME